MRILACVLMLLVSSACTKLPLDESQLRPRADIVEQVMPNSDLLKKIRVTSVTATTEAEDMVFDISPDAIKRVVSRALLKQGYIAPNKKAVRYSLSAVIEQVDVSGGFDIESRAVVSYNLVDTQDSIPVWQDTVVMPYVERFQLGADGTQKTQAAIEGALRENITHMVRLLADAPIPK